jgi:hypothetical protein
LEGLITKRSLPPGYQGKGGWAERNSSRKGCH